VVAIEFNLIPLGDRRITRSSPGRYERYLVYLPTDLNYVWRDLYEKKMYVRIYVELPEGIAKEYTRMPLGERRITRLIKGRIERYIVYLPTNLNYLWREIHENNNKIRMYIEMPRETIENIFRHKV